MHENKSSSDEILNYCCTNTEPLSSFGMSEIISEKSLQQSNLTCAQFYEDKLSSMLQIFPEVNKIFLFILIIYLRKVCQNLLQMLGKMV